MPQKTKASTRTAKKAPAKRSPVRHLHMLRLYSFSALAVALVAIQIVSGIQYEAENAHQRREVLAYATDVNIGDLLAATNQARATNGLGALTLNAKLNSGAQAKAQDMIAKNYWAHNAPDGTQPWKFFTAYGYQYQKAGENLAYGFDGSNQAVNGWMNSAGHRANILGAYKDIGFGIASGAGYQGGENTVIVAFYAVPYMPPPAPAPAAAVPKPTPTVATKPATTTVPAPAPTPAPTPAPAPVPVVQEAPKEEPKKQEAEQQIATTQPAKRITTLESMLTGNATWAMYASIGAMSVSTLGFAGTHLQLIRRGWRISRHFILVHPALDAAVLVALFATLLSSTTGFIK
jgi:uncharacterized protein YkwD